MSDKVTITLTDRQPVAIKKQEWPILATGIVWDNHDARRANRTWKLLVRRHADGRAIVYGIFEATLQDEPGRRGGLILPVNSNMQKVVTAIRSVGESLDMPENVIMDCIGDLPAEELA